MQVRDIDSATQIIVHGRGSHKQTAREWFTVIGILNLFELAPDLDRSVFIGHSAAETYLDHENLPTRVLVRVEAANASKPQEVDQVMTVLAATANPQFPEEVTVDKPSDALEALGASPWASWSRPSTLPSRAGPPWCRRWP